MNHTSGLDDEYVLLVNFLLVLPSLLRHAGAYRRILDLQHHEKDSIHCQAIGNYQIVGLVVVETLCVEVRLLSKFPDYPARPLNKPDHVWLNQNYFLQLQRGRWLQKDQICKSLFHAHFHLG